MLNCEAWLGRGNVLVDLKNYNDALAAFEKAVALSLIWLVPGSAAATCS